MPYPLSAILVIVPLIGAFFVLVLLPRLRRDEERRRRWTLPRPPARRWRP